MYRGAVKVSVSVTASLLKERVFSQVSSAIREAEFRSHKLVLVVLADEVRLQVEQELMKDDIELLNLSKHLSNRLVSLSLKERQKVLDKEVSNIAAACDSSTWLTKLDLLCEPSLNCDPIWLLKWLAKSQLIVAIWPGVIDGPSLTYSVPGREDYKTYPLKELKDIQVIEACDGEKE
nr:BREX-3 system P-loop-containing protein BrxF [Vibrio parahaemolyticus]